MVGSKKVVLGRSMALSGASLLILQRDMAGGGEVAVADVPRGSDSGSLYLSRQTNQIQGKFCQE